MKKTISMLLAVLMAAIAVCTFGVSAFADETTTLVNDDPTDGFVTEVPTTKEETTKKEEPTTKKEEETTQKAEVTTTAVAGTTEGTTEGTTKNPLEELLGALVSTTLPDITATRAPGQTYIDDSDETTKAAPATTKKPAKVESSIPSTGSTIVPVIALLALAAGTVAVVKTKKED